MVCIGQALTDLSDAPPAKNIIALDIDDRLLEDKFVCCLCGLTNRWHIEPLSELVQGTSPEWRTLCQRVVHSASNIHGRT